MHTLTALAVTHVVNLIVYNPYDFAHELAASVEHTPVCVCVCVCVCVFEREKVCVCVCVYTYTYNNELAVAEFNACEFVYALFDHPAQFLGSCSIYCKYE